MYCSQYILAQYVMHIPLHLSQSPLEIYSTITFSTINIYVLINDTWWRDVNFLLCLNLFYLSWQLTWMATQQRPCPNAPCQFSLWWRSQRNVWPIPSTRSQQGARGHRTSSCNLGSQLLALKQSSFGGLIKHRISTQNVGI